MSPVTVPHTLGKREIVGVISDQVERKRDPARHEPSGLASQTSLVAPAAANGTAPAFWSRLDRSSSVDLADDAGSGGRWFVGAASAVCAGRRIGLGQNGVRPVAIGQLSLAECAVVTVVTPALAVERQGVTADEIVLHVARLLTPLVLLMANLGASGGVRKSCVGCGHGYVARQGLSTRGAQAFLVACCSLGALPDACAVKGARELSWNAGAVRRLLGLPDELVGEEGEAVPDDLCIDEAHGFLVAGLTEEAFARPEHDREDDQPQLVDQVVLD
jgi:hypothetical protein